LFASRREALDLRATTPRAEARHARTAGRESGHEALKAGKVRPSTNWRGGTPATTSVA